LHSFKAVQLRPQGYGFFFVSSLLGGVAARADGTPIDAVAIRVTFWEHSQWV